jgi:hypothetical protein
MQLSGIVILMDDSAETVVSIYSEAFDLGAFKWLGPGSHGCCGGECSVGAVLVVVPHVLAQRVS